MLFFLVNLGLILFNKKRKSKVNISSFSSPVRASTNELQLNEQKMKGIVSKYLTVGGDKRHVDNESSSNFPIFPKKLGQSYPEEATGSLIYQMLTKPEVNVHGEDISNRS